MSAKYSTGCSHSNNLQLRPDQAVSHEISPEPGRKKYFLNPKCYTPRSSYNALFTIIYGDLNTRKNHDPKSKELLIGNTVYDTVVKGASSINQCKDYQGILQVKYEHKNQVFYIIFAIYFSRKAQSYFLISLGEYSMRGYQQDIKSFRYHNFTKHLHITLSPISKEGLMDLEQKLVRTNLSNATVCLLKETLSLGTE